MGTDLPRGGGDEQMALAFVRLVGRIRSSRKIDIRETLLIFTIVSVHDSMIIGTNGARIKGECESGSKNLEIGGKTAVCFKAESYFSTRRLFISSQSFVSSLIGSLKQQSMT